MERKWEIEKERRKNIRKEMDRVEEKERRRCKREEEMVYLPFPVLCR